MIPKYCPKCGEIIFAVKILRYNTSDRPVTQEMENIKFCPFCGERIDNYGQKTIQKDR